MSKRSALLTLSLCLLTTSALACSLIQTSTPIPPTLTPQPSTPPPAPPTATSEPPTPTPVPPTPTAARPAGWEAQRDEEYGFEVWYPEEFAVDPSCYPVAVRGDVALDLRLGGSEYYSGTNLLDACVIIGVSQDEAVTSTCLEPVDALEESLGEEEVNGIAFHKFSRPGVAAGNIFDEVSYRAVHSDACHEIALLMHSGNIGAYPEGTVTEFDREKILSKLKQVLSTFRFLK